jgi:predicted acylesterase/phospholipase RssA
MLGLAMRQLRAATLSAFMVLAGCATAPRLSPPPELIGSAVPEGFGPEVRLVTTDKTTFDARAARLFSRVGEAATDGTIDYLVLSGGGSGGSFGAGAMVGLSRAHHRPQFEVVTGVSAGALIAPFAYLGPSWDPVLTSAFTGGDGLELIHSKKLAVLKRLLLPRGRPGGSTLFKLVDRFVTPAMIQAVTREYAKGRLLFIATTDLDKQETVLWNLGAIATHGGEQARRLFRDVLIASASVPGVFPPVLIPVEEDGHHYQEMHVDGGVTTSLFAAPLIAQLFSQPSATLPNANLYVVINGKLASAPRRTPVNTIGILARAFSADFTYKSRDALLLAVMYSRSRHMRLHLTEIPPDYPYESFVDFRPESMRRLFDFGADCATEGLLWETAGQSLSRNMSSLPATGSKSLSCPATAVGRLH